MIDHDIDPLEFAPEGDVEAVERCVPLKGCMQTADVQRFSAFEVKSAMVQQAPASRINSLSPLVNECPCPLKCSTTVASLCCSASTSKRCELIAASTCGLLCQTS